MDTGARPRSYFWTTAAAGAVLVVALITLVALGPGPGHRPRPIVYQSSASASFTTRDVLAGSALDQPDLTVSFRPDATDDQLDAFFSDEFEGNRHLWHFAVSLNFISRKLQIRFVDGAPLDEHIDIWNALATSPLVERIHAPE